MRRPFSGLSRGIVPLGFAFVLAFFAEEGELSASPPELKAGIALVGLQVSFPDGGGLTGDLLLDKHTFFPLTLHTEASLDDWEYWDVGPYLSFSPDVYGPRPATHHHVEAGGTIGPVFALTDSLALALAPRLGVALDRVTVSDRTPVWAFGWAVGGGLRLDVRVGDRFKLWTRLSSGFSITSTEVEHEMHGGGTTDVGAATWEVLTLGVGGTFIFSDDSADE